MLEVYSKTKHGKKIQVLAINSVIGNDLHFPIIDIDEHVSLESLHHIKQTFGKTLVYSTQRGVHLYCPYYWDTLENILDKLEEFGIEKEFVTMSKERGYMTLRVSRVEKNKISFRDTLHGNNNQQTEHIQSQKRLEKFIRHLLKLTGNKTVLQLQQSETNNIEHVKEKEE